MASQFDFQITTEISRLQALVAVFRELDVALRSLSSQDFNINLRIPEGFSSRIDEINNRIREITSTPQTVTIQANTQQAQTEIDRLTAQIAGATKITPTFVNQLIKFPTGPEAGVRSFTDTGTVKIKQQFDAGFQAAERMTLALGRNNKSLKEWEAEIKNAENVAASLLNKINLLESQKTLFQLNPKIAGADPATPFGRFIPNIQGTIDETTQRYNSLSGTIKNVRSEFDQTAKQERLLEQEHLRQSRAIKSTTEILDFAIQKLIIYRIAFGALQKSAEAFTGSLKTFLSLEQEFADIAKVLRPVGDEIERIKEAGFDLARTYGGQVKSVVESMKIWAQAGLDVNQSIEATRVTLLAQNSIGLDSIQVTEALTAAIFGFKVQVEDLSQVIDGWMAVQAKYPLSAADLAAGIKRVGAAAYELGVTINQLNGYIAAVNAATRKSGQEIGNSLKTVFTRTLGEETINKLQELGFAVYTTEGNFRKLADIIDDIGTKWDELTNVQKKNIAVALGGVHRYVDVLALFSNYGIAQKAAIESENAFGFALEANQIQLETVNSLIARIVASFTELGNAIGGSVLGVLKQFADAIDSISKALAKSAGLAKFVGSLGILATTAIGVAATFYSLEFILTKLVTGFGGVTTKIVATNAVIAATGQEVAVTNIALTGLGRTIAWVSGIVGGVVAAFGLFITAMALIGDSSKKMLNFTTDGQASFNKLTEAITRNYQAHIKQIELIKRLDSERSVLIKRLEEEKNSEKAREEILKNLTDKNRELANISPILAAAIRDVGIAGNEAVEGQNKYKEALGKVIENEEALLNIQKKKLVAVVSPFVSDGGRGLVLLENQIENTEKTIDKIQELDIALAKLDVSASQTGATLLEAFTQFFDFIELNPKLKSRKFSDVFDFMNDRDIGKTLQQIQIQGLEIVNTFEKTLFDAFKESPVYSRINEDTREQLTKAISGLSNVFSKDVITGIFNIAKEQGKTVDEVILMGQNAINGFSNYMQQVVAQVAGATGQETEALLKKLGEFNLTKKILGDGGTDPVKIVENYFAKIEAEMNKAKESSAIFRDIFGVKQLETYIDRIRELNIKFEIGPEKLKEQLDLMKELSGKAQDYSGDLVGFFNSLITQQGNISESVTKDIIAARQAIDELKNKSGPAFAALVESIKGDPQKELETVLANRIKDLENLVRLLSGIVPDINNIIGEFQKQLISAANVRLQTIKDNVEAISFYIEDVRSGIDTYTKILQKSSSTERDINQYQQDRLTSLLIELKALRANTDEKLEQESLDKQILKLQKDISKLAGEGRVINWLEENRRLLEFRDNLHKSLSSGLLGITDILSQESSKRGSLRKEIVEAEQELNRAIQENDLQAISDARQELKELNEELGRHAAGLSEVMRIFNKIFTSIADTFFQQTVDNLTKTLSNKLIKIEAPEDIILGKIELTGENFNKNVNTAGIKFDNTIVDAVTKSGNIWVDAVLKSKQILETQEAQIMSLLTGGEFTTIGTDSKNKFQTPQANFAVPQALPDINPLTGELEESMKQSGSVFKELIKDSAIVFSNILSGTVISAIGGGPNAIRGSNIGSSLGSLAALGLKLNPFLSVLTGIGGGLLGGLFGGLFDNEEQPRILIENTQAIKANTQALEELGKTIINAPTRYRLPAFTGGAVSGINIGQINITSTTGDPQKIYQEFTRALERDYNRSVRTTYTRGRML